MQHGPKARSYPALAGLPHCLQHLSAPGIMKQGKHSHSCQAGGSSPGPVPSHHA